MNLESHRGRKEATNSSGTNLPSQRLPPVKEKPFINPLSIDSYMFIKTVLG